MNVGVDDMLLDSSAVLAIMLDEPGSDLTLAAWPDVHISAVNLAEVVARLVDRGLDHAQAVDEVDQLGLTVHPFDHNDALATAAMRAVTRHKRLSLADRACLSLALRLSMPVLTADRAWADARTGADVRLIR